MPKHIVGPPEAAQGRRLQAVESSPGEAVTGESLLNEICDLIEARLPGIPLDDPARRTLSALTPALAAALGRRPARAL